MRFHRIGLYVLLCCLPMSTISCGESSETGEARDTEMDLRPVEPALSAMRSTAFSLYAADCSQVVSANCTVQFTATTGTPFVEGTSDFVEVPATITPNGVVKGMSPQAYICGAKEFVAQACLVLPSGFSAESETSVARFMAPEVESIEPATCGALASPQPFALLGSHLAVGDGADAWVTIHWKSTEGIFNGGVDDETTTIAESVAADRIDGMTPSVVICGSAEAEVVIERVEFADGSCAYIPEEAPRLTYLAPTLDAVSEGSHPALADPTTVTIVGEFFAPYGAYDQVQVHWTCDTEIFENQTSLTTTSLGRVLSDTHLEVDVPPVAVCGDLEVVALIDHVVFPSGTCTLPGLPPAGTALEVEFRAPVLTSVAPDVFTQFVRWPVGHGNGPEEANWFTLQGQDLHAEFGNTTVDIHWRTGGEEHAIFEHGTAWTTVTKGTITSDSTIEGARPEVRFSGAFLPDARVPAWIDHVVFPDGTCSLAGPSPDGSSLPVGFDEPSILIDLPLVEQTPTYGFWDDWILVPLHRPAYALLVSGYTRNEKMDEIHWYPVAKYIAEEGGYLHMAWWNNLCRPYLAGPLHGDASPTVPTVIYEPLGYYWDSPEQDTVRVPAVAPHTDQEPGDTIRHTAYAAFADAAEIIEDINDLIDFVVDLVDTIALGLKSIGLGLGSVQALIDWVDDNPLPEEGGKAYPAEDYQFQKDAKTFLKAIDEYNPFAVIVIAGHSMGGCSVARLGAETDVEIDLLAPIDPVGNRTDPPWSNPLDRVYPYTRWRVTHEDPSGPGDLNTSLSKRKIGPHVKILHHRWQEEFLYPLDWYLPGVAVWIEDNFGKLIDFLEWLGIDIDLWDPDDYYFPRGFGTDTFWDTQAKVSTTKGGGVAYNASTKFPFPSLLDADPQELAEAAASEGHNYAPYFIWNHDTEGHGEIVGYRGLGKNGNLDGQHGNMKLIDSYPLAVRMRHWPIGAGTSKIAQRKALFLRLHLDGQTALPADLLSNLGYDGLDPPPSFDAFCAPLDPSMCRVSAGMLNLVLKPEDRDTWYPIVGDFTDPIVEWPDQEDLAPAPQPLISEP